MPQIGEISFAGTGPRVHASPDLFRQRFFRTQPQTRRVRTARNRSAVDLQVLQRRCRRPCPVLRRCARKSARGPSTGHDRSDGAARSPATAHSHWVALGVAKTLDPPVNTEGTPTASRASRIIATCLWVRTNTATSPGSTGRGSPSDCQSGHRRPGARPRLLRTSSATRLRSLPTAGNPERLSGPAPVRGRWRTRIGTGPNNRDFLCEASTGLRDDAFVAECAPP